MPKESHKLLPGREYPDPGENELISKVIALTNAQMARLYKNSHAWRQVHAKSHGLVKARFIIEDNLPDQLRAGLFKTPATYPAWIRFSNGVTEIRHDKKRDVRGVAIKLMNVPGDKLLDMSESCHTHDFILASSPFFFSRNLKDFMGLLRVAIASNKLVKGMYGLLNAHLLVRALFKVQGVCRHLFSIPYFSGTPYQFGDENRAVKYSLRPSPGNEIVFADKKNPDFLREGMVRTLCHHTIRFDFCIQQQLDPVKMPVENASVEWKSPFIKVATLEIPAQDFSFPERDEFAEHLTFNVWRCLPEHRPLGGFNRARRFIYKELYKTRSNINEVHVHEPSAGPDFFDDLKKPI